MGRRYSLLMFVAMFVLLAVVAIGYTGHVQSQFVCGARYDTALRERSQVLSQIAVEDRQLAQAAEENITRLITDAIAAAGDRVRGQQAAQRYLQTSAQISRRRAELERQRRAQPFPQTPERTCT